MEHYLHTIHQLMYTCVIVSEFMFICILVLLSTKVSCETYHFLRVIAIFICWIFLTLEMLLNSLWGHNFLYVPISQLILYFVVKLITSSMCIAYVTGIVFKILQVDLIDVCINELCHYCLVCGI